MLIPTGTDAPIYYWPFATVGLIFINTFIFFAHVTNGIPPATSNWILLYQDGISPHQWLGCMFMHMNVSHLIGNMLFLWAFGLVVEGKLGWLKFLLLYLGIGLLQAASQETIGVLIGMPGGALGASAAIYGILVTAAIWAPKNCIQVWTTFWFSVYTFDVSILVVAGLYCGMDIFMILYAGGNAGSSILHAGGMLFGAIAGVLLLKSGTVDCEGWDLFSIYFSNTEHLPLTATKKKNVQKELAQNSEKRKQKQQASLPQALLAFREMLNESNLNAALKLYRRTVETATPLQLAPDDLIQIINALHQAQRWKGSAEFMDLLIKKLPHKTHPYRLKLAQICVMKLERPSKALEILNEIDLTKLSEKQILLMRKILKRAHQMQAAGVVELDIAGWESE